MPPTEARTVDDIQLGTMGFWAQPLDERNAAFATLRERCPIAFHPELETLEGAPEGPGFWSITRYDDVRTVSRQPQIFSSEGGITLSEDSPDTREFFGSMIVLDDPRHSKLRLLVQKAFTPKTVAAIDDRVRVRARQLVADGGRAGQPATSCRRSPRPCPCRSSATCSASPRPTSRTSSTGPTSSSAPATPSSAAPSRPSSTGPCRCTATPRRSARTASTTRRTTSSPT